MQYAHQGKSRNITLNLIKEIDILNNNKVIAMPHSKWYTTIIGVNGVSYVCHFQIVDNTLQYIFDIIYSPLSFKG